MGFGSNAYLELDDKGNPFIKHISGVAIVGQTLSIELGGMKFKLAVQEVEQCKIFFRKMEI